MKPHLPTLLLVLVLTPALPAAAQDGPAQVQSDADRTCEYVAAALTPEVDRIEESLRLGVTNARGRLVAGRLDSAFYATEFLIAVGLAYADTGEMGMIGEMGLRHALDTLGTGLENERAAFERLKPLAATGGADEAQLAEAAAMLDRLAPLRDGTAAAVFAAMEINPLADFDVLLQEMADKLPLAAQSELAAEHGLSISIVGAQETGRIAAAEQTLETAIQLAELVQPCIAARRAVLDRIPMDWVELTGPATLSIGGADYEVELTDGVITLTFSHGGLGGDIVFSDGARFLIYSGTVNDDGSFRTGFYRESGGEGRWWQLDLEGRIQRVAESANGWQASGRFVLDAESRDVNRDEFRRTWGESATLSGTWQAQ